MSRSWIFAAIWLAWFVPSLAGADPADAPNAADRQAIRDVIQAQLDAFQRDDGHAAFSHASPFVRRMFRTPENFMAMVRRGYAAVYRPRAVTFLETRTEAGQTGQMMRFVGPDGVAVTALYVMERQPDGTWKINGVFLFQADETVT